MAVSRDSATRAARLHEVERDVLYAAEQVATARAGGTLAVDMLDHLEQTVTTWLERRAITIRHGR